MQLQKKYTFEKCKRNIDVYILHPEKKTFEMFKNQALMCVSPIVDNS